MATRTLATLGPEGSYCDQAIIEYSCNHEYELRLFRTIKDVCFSGCDVLFLPLHTRSGVWFDETCYNIPHDVFGYVIVPVESVLASKETRIQDIHTVFGHHTDFSEHTTFLRNTLSHTVCHNTPSSSSAALHSFNTPRSAALCSIHAASLYNLPTFPGIVLRTTITFVLVFGSRRFYHKRVCSMTPNLII